MDKPLGKNISVFPHTVHKIDLFMVSNFMKRKNTHCCQDCEIVICFGFVKNINKENNKSMEFVSRKLCSEYTTFRTQIYMLSFREREP